MVLTQKFYCIFPYHHTTTGENLKMIVYFSLELWFFKVVKVDVCGRLVLSHSVTFEFFSKRSRYSNRAVTYSQKIQKYSNKTISSQALFDFVSIIFEHCSKAFSKHNWLKLNHGWNTITNVSSPGFLKDKVSNSVLNHFNFADVTLVVWIPYWCTIIILKLVYWIVCNLTLKNIL